MQNDFIYSTRVYIEDTDYGGVVYHGNYLKYFERARSEWAFEAGIGIDWQKQHGIFLAVHAINIEFIKPARLFDQIEVVSRLSQLRSASLMFEQHLRLAADTDKILCKASVRLVCTDENIKARPLPPSPFLDSMRR